MRAFELLLLNVLMNGLWQAPLVLLAALAAAWLVRRSGPGAEHRVWVAALLLQVSLPIASLFGTRSLWAAMRWVLARLHTSNAAASGNVTVKLGAAHAHAGPMLPMMWVKALIAIYLVIMIAQVVRLTVQGVRTRRLVQRSRPLRGETVALPVAGTAVGAWIGVSREIASPVAVGFMQGLVLIPLGWRRHLAAEDVHAAFAHEAAHLLRHDFAKNLLYEVLACPLAFHPALWMTRRRLSETREMVCDEVAARSLPSARIYARSLLRLATAAMEQRATPTLHYGIGFFDAGILERRIMQLTQRSTPLRTGHRVLQAAGVAVLFLITASSAVGLALKVDGPDASHAQASHAPVVESGVMAGQILSKANPVYPPDAKAKHIQGDVVLKAIIGENGHIQALVVLSGPKELQGSALDAVRQWVYTPYILNGQPTTVETRISVNYQMF